jgi:hypothetical protein
MAWGGPMLPRTGWWRLGQPIGDFGSVIARDKFRLLALSAIPNPRPNVRYWNQQRTTVRFSLWPFCPLTKSGPYG